MISLNIDHVMTAPSVLLSVAPATVEFESCYQHTVRRLKKYTNDIMLWFRFADLMISFTECKSGTTKKIAHLELILHSSPKI
jgi:hypothetical protein